MFLSKTSCTQLLSQDHEYMDNHLLSCYIYQTLWRTDNIVVSLHVEIEQYADSTELFHLLKLGWLLWGPLRVDYHFQLGHTLNQQNIIRDKQSRHHSLISQWNNRQTYHRWNTTNITPSIKYSKEVLPYMPFFIISLKKPDNPFQNHIFICSWFVILAFDFSRFVALELYI
jgi:hypothetical protein